MKLEKKGDVVQVKRYHIIVVGFAVFLFFSFSFFLSVSVAFLFCLLGYWSVCDGRWSGEGMLTSI